MFLALLEKHGAIHDGSRILELGTGWVHWDSFFLRLFYDLHISMYDVWDNRDFKALHCYIQDLKEVGKEPEALFEGKAERAHSLLEASLKISSFEELYKLLGFEYILNKEGWLTCFGDESFDLVISDNVLEHIEANALQEYVRDIARVLKPGGYSCHHIVISDHLAAYDSRVNKKNYLRYSEKVWKAFFENKVQYFNRVQSSEWEKLFHEAGLQILKRTTQWRVDVSHLKIAKQFKGVSRQDLECCGLNLLHKKPN
jgi:SAM-dependent methyltransferase